MNHPGLATMRDSEWAAWLDGYQLGLVHGIERGYEQRVDEEATAAAAAFDVAGTVLQRATSRPVVDARLITADHAEILQIARDRECAGIERFRASVREDTSRGAA